MEEFKDDREITFSVNAEHMTKEVPLPLQAEEFADIEFSELMALHEDTEFSEELLDLWRGYNGSRLFSSKDDAKHRLQTYDSYLQSTNKEDVKNFMRIILHELKTHPADYETAGILLALAQNGGVCKVQMEVGIRMVYAAMTDSVLQHVEASSIETAVLNLLRNIREALSERVAQEVLNEASREMNTHYILTLRNRISERIGVPNIPDPNAYSIEKDADTLYNRFMEMYSTDKIVKVISEALNDKQRKIDYEDAVDYFGKHIPENMEKFEFLNDHVFDMETGHFKRESIQFMLCKMGILIADDGIEFVGLEDN